MPVPKPQPTGQVSAPPKVLVGKVTHYFDKIGVAVIELTKALEVGDKVWIGGKTPGFEMVIESMQIEKDRITTANSGQSIGLKTAQPVKDGDEVYKLG
jgi:putative protease